MDYRNELRRYVKRYYDEIVVVYKKTTTEAMADARKLSAFRKKDFSRHTAAFRQHIEDAEALDISGIEIPPEDVKSKLLADLFEKSIHSFIGMCEENIAFYDMTDRKQYRGSGITVKIYKEKADQMQKYLIEAVKDLDALDQAYQEYCADNFADEQ